MLLVSPSVAIHNAASRAKSFGKTVKPAKHTRANWLLPCVAEATSGHPPASTTQDGIANNPSRQRGDIPLKLSGAHLLLPCAGRLQVCCMPLLLTVSSGSWASCWGGVPMLLRRRRLRISLGRRMLLGRLLLLSILLLGWWLLLSVLGQLRLLGR